MSIYSGFPTRRDEEKYNGLLSKLIATLQNHLMEFISEVPQIKIVTYSKIISKMRDYEQHKYLPPKFSQLIDPLCKVMGISTSIDQKISIIEEGEENKNQALKVKVSQSLSKYRTRSNYQIVNVKQQNKPRGDSMIQNKNVWGNQGIVSKRSHFQSAYQLKEHKINYNKVPPKENPRLKSSQNYDQTVEHLQKWTTLGQTKTAKGGALISKLKSNLRYHNFKPFLQSKQNIKGQKLINDDSVRKSNHLEHEVQ